MKTLDSVSKVFVIAFLAFLLVRVLGIAAVQPGDVGVRVSQVGGVVERDMGPGWHMQIIGVHQIHSLPAHWMFLDYTNEQALEIRTKDNNIVTVDVSVPYRLVPGEANMVVKAGNHVGDGKGGYRFQRLTHDTTVGVLREHLAELQSSDFYDTDRRLEVAEEAAEVLNEKLAGLHVETNGVLIRAAYFKDAYEKQLAQIQLNSQQELLNKAGKKVADKQQELDNYEQDTEAQAATKEADWAKRIAELDRAYQVGFIEMKPEEVQVGGARTKLGGLEPPAREALVASAAEVFSMKAEEVTDDYLLGIKNIEAETLEYDRRVRAGADGVAERLKAEANALIAEVNAAYETRLNELLSTPAGRAYVAYNAAGNVQFDDELTFQSSDGIPSVLRLRDFARKFMGL